MGADRTASVEFDGVAICRVGTVVYSIHLDRDGTVVREPWAICDHCGWVPGVEIAVMYDAYEAWIRADLMAEHVCPGPDEPLPATSVCARRPCRRCQEHRGVR